MGNVRVRGLRLVDNKNWSRFNSEFRVPEDCSMTGIRAKYENGNLYITIPKKKPSKTPKEEPKMTASEMEQPHPLSSSKPSESQMAQPHLPSKQSALQSLPLPETGKIQQKLPQIPPRAKEQERPPQPEIQPEAPMPADVPRTQNNKMPFGNYDYAPSETLFSENHDDKPKEWENPESLAERILKGGAGKAKEPSASVKTSEELEHERKEHLDNRARETEALIGARLSSGLKLEDYMKNAREKLSEERQTLVNVGAAVLVITGLTIYICCNIGGKIHSS